MTAIQATAGADASLKELFSLLKPRVMTLVVFSGAVGMWIAPGHLHPLMQFLTILCIALGSGAGAMINMWFDRDIDAVMHRTSHRPIPSGKIHADDVLAGGIMLAVFAVVVMSLATNWQAAAWLAFAIFFYSVIYTMWLKRSTPQNIVIGGAAGAFPPLIGWVAATGHASVEAWILFAIIFLWTPPHFWALALFRNNDYTRANVPMMPVTHGLAHTSKHMFAYSLLLLASTLAPYAIGLSGELYAIAATLLSLRFSWMTYVVMRDPTNEKQAKRLFGFSIVYLFSIFSLLLLDGIIA